MDGKEERREADLRFIFTTLFHIVALKIGRKEEGGREGKDELRNKEYGIRKNE
jgi:hypothetical protein